jgi:hypothetical protein
MGGLARICKLLGGIKVTSDGKTVEHVWDYDHDEAVPKDKMSIGSDRWKRSEKAKWDKIMREKRREAVQDAMAKKG